MRVNEGARWFASFRFKQDGQRLWGVSPMRGFERFVRSVLRVAAEQSRSRARALGRSRNLGTLNLETLQLSLLRWRLLLIKQPHHGVDRILLLIGTFSLIV